MPRHIVVLTALLVALLTSALVAKSYFTVSSFYEFGHYRGDSVPEIAALEVQYKGAGYCVTCHEENFQAWTKSDHKTVQCENCHGAAVGHGLAKLVRLQITTDPVRLCGQCHEAMPGRPAQIKQIDVAKHTGDLSCIACHSPHSPKPAVAPEKVVGDASAGKVAAAACAECHGAAGISQQAGVPSLAGQSAAYLAKALAEHKPAKRADGTAMAIDALHAKDLAVYFAGLDCAAMAPQAAAGGDAGAGEKLAGLCTACHGPGGRGGHPSWPKLAMQQPAYLTSQLQAIKDAKRDVPVMADLAGGLSTAEIANLAAYYAASQCRLRTAGN